ncbi:hypothetical protein PG984_006597 [Apiospora sp. TS-2023a]
MTDIDTGLDCSYLFWEAESRAKRGDYAPKTDLDVFNPAFPKPFLHHRHEVLPFEQLITRIDAILKDLCLTAAMRTEFIVYWLPAFQRIRDREQLIKFTFVPQEAFEKAAAIYISGAEAPRPSAESSCSFQASTLARRSLRQQSTGSAMLVRIRRL